MRLNNKNLCLKYKQSTFLSLITATLAGMSIDNYITQKKIEDTESLLKLYVYIVLKMV